MGIVGAYKNETSFRKPLCNTVELPNLHTAQQENDIRQFFSTSGKRHFLSEHNVLLKDFPDFAQQVSQQVTSHVEALTQSQDRPLIYLPSAQDSKEETARAVLLDSPIKEGLICTISVVEPCQTLQPKKKDNGHLELVTVNRKCKYGK